MLNYQIVWFWLPQVSCQSGVWSGAGNSQIVSATATAWRFPSTTAWCPAGKKVVGGGATCSTPGGSIWLVHSLPIGDNGWSGTCDTTQKQNASIVVYATCLWPWSRQRLFIRFELTVNPVCGNHSKTNSLYRLLMWGRTSLIRILEPMLIAHGRTWTVHLLAAFKRYMQIVQIAGLLPIQDGEITNQEEQSLSLA